MLDIRTALVNSAANAETVSDNQKGKVLRHDEGAHEERRQGARHVRSDAPSAALSGGAVAEGKR